MTPAEWDALAADAKRVSTGLSTVGWWVGGILAGTSDERQVDQAARMLRIVMDDADRARVVATRLAEMADEWRDAEFWEEAKGADTE